MNKTRITTQEAAEMIGIDKRTLRVLIAAGEFPAKAVWHSKKHIYYIYREDVQKWLG